jgi:hypothetical protein
LAVHPRNTTGGLVIRRREQRQFFLGGEVHASAVAHMVAL